MVTLTHTYCRLSAAKFPFPLYTLCVKESPRIYVSDVCAVLALVLHFQYRVNLLVWVQDTLLASIDPGEIQRPHE